MSNIPLFLFTKKISELITNKRVGGKDIIKAVRQALLGDIFVLIYRSYQFSVLIPSHPKQYAEWSKIKPIDIEELELATGSNDDLSFENLTTVLLSLIHI